MSDASEFPALLRSVSPEIGSVWHWEPLKPHASEQVTVTDVIWNGEEVWVESENPDGRRCKNELSRWVEATVMVAPASSGRVSLLHGLVEFDA